MLGSPFWGSWPQEACQAAALCSRCLNMWLSSRLGGNGFPSFRVQECSRPVFRTTAGVRSSFPPLPTSPHTVGAHGNAPLVSTAPPAPTSPSFPRARHCRRPLALGKDRPKARVRGAAAGCTGTHIDGVYGNEPGARQGASRSGQQRRRGLRVRCSLEQPANEGDDIAVTMGTTE